MSEARKMHEGILGESGESRLARTSDSSVFTTITEKVSTGIEQLAGMIHEKSASLSGDDKTAKYADYGKRAANALHSSANYIRQADANQMQSDLRDTIKRNPERSLLVGIGVGILVGSILRRKG
jgi:ElaB/YqjD/DUF883 family membrane-anchored ribosome-binding protein